MKPDRPESPLKRSEMPVEEYALKDWRSLIAIMHTMSAPEIRRALNLEWRGSKRYDVLRRLTLRLCNLERDAKLAELERLFPKKPTKAAQAGQGATEKPGGLAVEQSVSKQQLANQPGHTEMPTQLAGRPILDASGQSVELGDEGTKNPND